MRIAWLASGPEKGQRGRKEGERSSSRGESGESRVKEEAKRLREIECNKTADGRSVIAV